MLSRDTGSEMMENAPMTIRYQYDDLDRLVAVQLPDGRSFRYSYDPSGNLVSIAPDGRAPAVAPAIPVPAPVSHEASRPPVVCSRCGGEAKPGAQFCGKCGTPLAGMPVMTGTPAPKCPKCGSSVNLGANFCPKCGNNLF